MNRLTHIVHDFKKEAEIRVFPFRLNILKLDWSLAIMITENK